MYRDRGFLNATHGLAAFQWEADGEHNVFEIRDCSRIVCLDCSIQSPGDWFVALTKIVRLRRALQEFERALLDAYRSRQADDAHDRHKSVRGDR